jgi:hypothetical protein
MVDVSKLVISVDSDGAKVGGLNLEKLAKAGEKAEKSTDSLDVSVTKLTKHFQAQAINAGKSSGEIKILELKAKGATDAQLKAATAALKNAEAMKMQADQARFAAKSAGATGGAFRAMRGSTQQLSWQLQDVAVQAQMGTSAFTIMGQQGPQIASIFGSGGAVFGALIAFGAILAGAVYNSLNDTGDAMKDLKETNKSLIDSFDDLTEVQRKYARSLAQANIAENNAQIREFQQELNNLKDIRLNFADILGFGKSLGFKERHEEMERLEADIESLGQKNDLLVRQTDDTTDATEDLIKKLKEEKGAIGANSVVLAYQEGVRAKANDEQLRTIVLLAAQNLAAEEALEKTTKTNEATKKTSEEQEAYNANLHHQLRLLQETGPALDAYKASVKGGTTEQQKANAELERRIRVLKEKIAVDAEADKKAAAKSKSDEKAAERDKEAAKKLVEQIALQNMTELEQLKEHQKTKLAQLDQDLAAGHILEQQYLDSKAHMKETYRLAEELATEESNKKIYDSDKAYADAKNALDQQVLSSAAGVIGQLADAAEEGSNAQKALFAIQKGIAIATAIVNTELAAATALAPPPLGLGPVAGAGYAQVIRAMGYASVGIMAGTAIAGGRALGGQVRGGESYLVGERGPELLTMGTSGRIATNENLKNAVGGDSGSGVTINQTINVTTGIQSTVRAEIVQLMPQIAQAAKGAVADGRQRGGNFSRAMSGA